MKGNGPTATAAGHSGFRQERQGGHAPGARGGVAGQQMARARWLDPGDAQRQTGLARLGRKRHGLRQRADRAHQRKPLGRVLQVHAQIVQRSANLQIGRQHRIGRNSRGMLVTEPQNSQCQQRSGQAGLNGRSHTQVIDYALRWLP